MGRRQPSHGQATIFAWVGDNPRIPRRQPLHRPARRSRGVATSIAWCVADPSERGNVPRVTCRRCSKDKAMTPVMVVVLDCQAKPQLTLGYARDVRTSATDPAREIDIRREKPRRGSLGMTISR